MALVAKQPAAGQQTMITTSYPPEATIVVRYCPKIRIIINIILLLPLISAFGMSIKGSHLLQQSSSMAILATLEILAILAMEEAAQQQQGWGRNRLQH